MGTKSRVRAKHMLLVSLIVLSSLPLHARPLIASGQEKYLFSGLEFDLDDPSLSFDYDIFTGDFPFALHIAPGTFSLYTGLPLHRPTPFFGSVGTENQFGYYDSYSERNLLQSMSLGFTWDLFDTGERELFYAISSRWDALSLQNRFLETSESLVSVLSLDLEDFSLSGQIDLSLTDGSLLSWCLEGDFRVYDSYSLRLGLGDGGRLSIKLGISHVDPPADTARDYQWDYLGAHRGSMVLYPENSIPAFEYAIHRPEVSFIETDMNITSDGEYVAIHDLGFLRYVGRMDSIIDLEYDQIMQIDLGSFFDPQYSNLRALTLEDTAELFEPFSEQGFIMLEVKIIGEGEEEMRDFLEKARAAYADSARLSYMTLYYENADLLKQLLEPDESWGLCFLNAPSLPPFLLYSGFIYPLFEYEMTEIVRRYEPDYIILTSDFIEYYQQCRTLSRELGVDFLFWDFKDTIYALSADGSPGPSFFPEFTSP